MSAPEVGATQGETAAGAIGELVRNRRRAAGLSQRELAELAGVGTRLVSELERGKSTLRIDAVLKVLGVFNKTLGVCDAPRTQESGP